MWFKFKKQNAGGRECHCDREQRREHQTKHPNRDHLANRVPVAM